MSTREARVLKIAEIVRDAAAMNDAALDRDFDEARFRVLLVIDKLEVAGLDTAAKVAVRVANLLGRPGTNPRSGYGEAMLTLASTLDEFRI